MIIVSLIGLKKCGKTTTPEALIRQFKKRGFKVGAVKCMPHSKFTIDCRGKDTFRHKQAGADFVISLSDGEIGYIEKLSGRAKLADALRLIPHDTEILICEGLVKDEPNVLKVVLAKRIEMLEETFKIRGVRNNIIALSGIMANEIENHPDYPVFNCVNQVGASVLADLILKKSTLP